MKKFITIITALVLLLSQSQFVFALDSTSSKKDMIVEVAKQQGISEQQGEIWVNYLISGKLTDYQQKLYDRAYPRLKVMIEKNGDVYRSKVLSLLKKTANSVLKKNMDYHIVLTSLASKIGTDGFIKDFENKLEFVNFRDFTRSSEVERNIVLASSNEPDWSYGNIWPRQYNSGFDNIWCRIYKLYDVPDIHISKYSTVDMSVNANVSYGSGSFGDKFTISRTNSIPFPTGNKDVNSLVSMTLQYKYDEKVKPSDYSDDEAFMEALDKTKYLEPTMNRDELFKKENLISVSKPRFVKEWISDISYIELVKRNDISLSDDKDSNNNLYILSCSLVGG